MLAQSFSAKSQFASPTWAPSQGLSFFADLFVTGPVSVRSHLGQGAPQSSFSRLPGARNQRFSLSSRSASQQLIFPDLFLFHPGFFVRELALGFEQGLISTLSHTTQERPWCRLRLTQVRLFCSLSPPSSNSSAFRLFMRRSVSVHIMLLI
jgi:hypothetical protein